MPQIECPTSTRIMTVHGNRLQPRDEPSRYPKALQVPKRICKYPRAGWILPKGPNRRPEVTLGQPEGPLREF